MITVQNYNSTITGIDLDSLPAPLRSTHDKLMAKGGANFYGKNDAITETIDTYIAKLNEYVGSSSGVPKVEKPSAHSVVEKKAKTKKVKAHSVSSVVEKKPFVVELKEKHPSKHSIETMYDFATLEDAQRFIKKEYWVRTKEEKVNFYINSEKVTDDYVRLLPDSFAFYTAKTKKPKSVVKKKPVKAKTKKVAKTKAVTKAFPPRGNGKGSPPHTITRTIKSPELTALTRIANMGKRGNINHRSMAGFVASLGKGLKADKFIDHKTLLSELHGKLAKLISSPADTYQVALSKDTTERIQKAVSGAKERLRVSFLAGLSPKGEREGGLGKH